MNRRTYLGAMLAGLAALTCPTLWAAPTTNECVVVYFSWFENVAPGTITRAAIEKEAQHSMEMDASVSQTDALSAASLAGPGVVTRTARWIADEIGAPLLPIIVRDPYPIDFDACYEQASNERVRRFRPALSEATQALLPQIQAAKTVVLVFPNWDYALPVAVQTLLAAIDWSGKTVLPACLHGTGGLSRTIRELHETVGRAKGAKITTPLSIYRLEINRSESRVRAWARSSSREAQRQ